MQEVEEPKMRIGAGTETENSGGRLEVVLCNREFDKIIWWEERKEGTERKRQGLSYVRVTGRRRVGGGEMVEQRHYVLSWDLRENKEGQLAPESPEIVLAGAETVFERMGNVSSFSESITPAEMRKDFKNVLGILKAEAGKEKPPIDPNSLEVAVEAIEQILSNGKVQSTSAQQRVKQVITDGAGN